MMRGDSFIAGLRNRASDSTHEFGECVMYGALCWLAIVFAIALAAAIVL